MSKFVNEETLLVRAIKDGCFQLTTQNDDFWILAALTDRGFEVPSEDYISAIEACKGRGVPPDLLFKSKKGITQSLSSIIGDVGSIDTCICSHCVPDLYLFAFDTAEECAVEVKFYYDLTKGKHYGEFSKDRDKLLELRRKGFAGDLFQIAYFLTLPNGLVEQSSVNAP